MRFKQSQSDPCIYASQSDGLFVLGVYVDDIIIAGKSLKNIAEVKSTPGKRFEVKDLEELHYFLGVNVQQSPDSGQT